MSDHLHSSGAISIEEQVAGVPVQHWEGLSEASSIVIAPTHWQEIEKRVMEWFEERGVHLTDPEQLLEEAEDRFKRSVSLRSSTQINYKPSLSRRVKILSQLHINLDPCAAAPSRLTDSC